MKKIKVVLFALSVALMLYSCDTAERAKLQRTVDSLNVELQASQRVEQAMAEVGQLLDSIDANRQLLRSRVVEGTTYSDYTERLKEINTFIKDSKNKINDLEKAIKKSRGQAAVIARLQKEVEERSNQILALQTEVDRMHSENQSMQVTLTQRDSLITTKEEVIKVREESIASLEGLVKDITEQSQMSKANLYFDQAQALELAAKRTAFAPKKKKETKREALELYRLSLSLGKQEAQERITALEKDLS